MPRAGPYAFNPEIVMLRTMNRREKMKMRSVGMMVRITLAVKGP